ncbi:MAG: SDR family NAD(P)-dependent oxidoreductase [Pyrinomonadaceae bacterium]|nr:SDR family NAD(P)-dependent oxidoreductase [Pyrinomonadaceae bacterium]
MRDSIAVVGMACRYPDARSPSELWENVLSERRAFRRMPPERLRLEDYFSTNRAAPDCFYSTEAALIEGYEFDRVRFRVAGSTFRTADWTHWLALDVAAQALSDAGFADGLNLPLETTGVFLGNTLTGEFSRANGLRLRWPYVRRVVEASLAEAGITTEQRLALLKNLETSYKAPFPDTNEESLAGGLSNTIAGRICNYFDLKGGGYTVDGACASSLLAVAQACNALVAGDVDAALAGGVDLSMDPFELVGFAKTGALAQEMMRVYDVRSQGFWPGEGCGFVLLLREEDARARGLPIYATIKGWGISSDGHGGITRPEVEGQMLALERAYARAGFGIETVAYFEGHGTGTSVGDTTELRALSRARRQASPASGTAVIGSLKANIGHTKAAAGVAGLIKAVLALQARILPPTTGCEEPHPELKSETPALRVLKQGEQWPREQSLRAGVSAMGFGGINVHLALEGETPKKSPVALSFKERMLISSAQDAELFLLGARSLAELQGQVEHLQSFAFKLSRAELSDLAAQLSRTLDQREVRAALVVSTPAELAGHLARLKALIASGADACMDAQSGLFFSSTPTSQSKAVRVGFLFPGQGSPVHTGGGALRRRFEFVTGLYERAHFQEGDNSTATAVAQPAIVTASMAALRVLERLDITAHVAVGHSLGEMTALHWAGALDEEALLRLATVRGRAMMEVSGPPGAMASIAAGRVEVAALLNGDRANIAGLNSPGQTVLSGEAQAIEALVSRAVRQGFRAARLPVSHAFHSPLVAEAAPVLAAHLADERLKPLERTVFSTITGSRLCPETDLRALLFKQVTSPVLFMDAVVAADAAGVDLWIEVGPGHVLCGLAGELVSSPVVSIDAGGRSLKGLLQTAGAAFALGSQLNHAMLFEGRFTRNLSLNWHPKFFVNPCELAPLSETLSAGQPAQLSREDSEAEALEALRASSIEPSGASALEVIMQLVAARAELPAEAVKHDSRMLNDLHLNSITVGQLVGEAARRLGVPSPLSPTDYADATVAEIAEALTAQTHHATLAHEAEESPLGVAKWVRPFTVELIETALRRREPPAVRGSWQVLAHPSHPLADAVRSAFTACDAGRGCVVCLSPEPDESDVSLLLEGARAVLSAGEGTWFVLVQQDGGSSAFARTLHLEAPQVNTCVVNVPFAAPRAAERVVEEALSTRGYSEAHYKPDGRRFESVLRARVVSGPDSSAARLPLGADDVLVVTGGAKGITAECALAVSLETGARLALIGRAEPFGNVELAESLKRFTDAGVEFRYIAADVTNASAINAAMRRIESELGPVTGILHGAARNMPQSLSKLDEQSFQETLAVKVQGARNLLAAVDPERLRLLITFGSIIARTGLPGEADYGLANERLTRLTERWQALHPACLCLAVEWSIWSDVGMGARLGQMDALRRQGIEPIPPGDGVALLLKLLSQPQPSTTVVVIGRYADMPTYKIERPELPLGRYLEQAKVYYPNVELVVDSNLSTGTDPYLNDHQFQGERLLPAVMGLEAMAQAAAALTGATDAPAFRDVNFNRPVVVPEAEQVTIRVAALVREPGVVEVVLRSGETAFQVDHFRATCLFDKSRLRDVQPPALPPAAVDAEKHVSIHPVHDLYETILFHRGRFRRLKGYRFLKATECVAEITPDGDTSWFSQYLPAGLILGDPGGRDAAIHSIQACIPHATLLPIGVDRVSFDKALNPSEPLCVHALERSQDGSTFVYDLNVTGADGLLRERWEGLRLRLIANSSFRGAWPVALLGPYIERRLREFYPPAKVSVVCEREVTLARQERSDRAIQNALGRGVEVLRLPGGKPYVTEEMGVSAAHCGELTLAVSGTGATGCDLEQVSERTAAVWLDLLCAEGARLAGIIARSVPEEQGTAATRVWAARESLKKAGALGDAPLLLVSSEADGWVLLSSGSLRIATWETEVRGCAGKLVVAVLLGDG